MEIFCEIANGTPDLTVVPSVEAFTQCGVDRPRQGLKRPVSGRPHHIQVEFDKGSRVLVATRSIDARRLRQLAHSARPLTCVSAVMCIRKLICVDAGRASRRDLRCDRQHGGRSWNRSVRLRSVSASQECSQTTRSNWQPRVFSGPYSECCLARCASSAVFRTRPVTLEGCWHFPAIGMLECPPDSLEMVGGFICQPCRLAASSDVHLPDQLDCLRRV